MASNQPFGELGASTRFLITYRIVDVACVVGSLVSLLSSLVPSWSRVSVEHSPADGVFVVFFFAA
jgi:hypothetical protein